MARPGSTQPLMHRLDTDLAPVLMSVARGDLGRHRLEWRRGASVCVVLASAGYPGAYRTGVPIHGVEEAEAAGAGEEDGFGYFSATLAVWFGGVDVEIVVCSWHDDKRRSRLGCASWWSFLDFW